jgi:hypothetical protein
VRGALGTPTPKCLRVGVTLPGRANNRQATGERFAWGCAINILESVTKMLAAAGYTAVFCAVIYSLRAALIRLW